MIGNLFLALSIACVSGSALATNKTFNFDKPKEEYVNRASINGYYGSDFASLTDLVYYQVQEYDTSGNQIVLPMNIFRSYSFSYSHLTEEFQFVISSTYSLRAWQDNSEDVKTYMIANNLFYYVKTSVSPIDDDDDDVADSVEIWVEPYWVLRYFPNVDSQWKVNNTFAYTLYGGNRNYDIVNSYGIGASGIDYVIEPNMQFNEYYTSTYIYNNFISNLYSNSLNNTNMVVGGDFAFHFVCSLDDKPTGFRFFTPLYSNPFYITSDDVQSGFNQGYDVGYQNGYVNGQQDGQNQGYQQGLSVGWQNGYAEGITVNQGGFKGLLGSIADTPIRFLRNMFNFELFGMNVAVIILSCLSAIVVFGIVRKIWK